MVVHEHRARALTRLVSGRAVPLICRAQARIRRLLYPLGMVWIASMRGIHQHPSATGLVGDRAATALHEHPNTPGPLPLHQGRHPPRGATTSALCAPTPTRGWTCAWLSRTRGASPTRRHDLGYIDEQPSWPENHRSRASIMSISQRCEAMKPGREKGQHQCKHVCPMCWRRVGPHPTGAHRHCRVRCRCPGAAEAPNAAVPGSRWAAARAGWRSTGAARRGDDLRAAGTAVHPS